MRCPAGAARWGVAGVAWRERHRSPRILGQFPGIYAGGVVVVDLIIHLLYDAFHASWLLSLPVLAPAEASNAMITAGRAFQDAPPWWVGGLVLAGYGVALTVAGGISIRRSKIA